MMHKVPVFELIRQVVIHLPKVPDLGTLQMLRLLYHHLNCIRYGQLPEADFA